MAQSIQRVNAALGKHQVTLNQRTKFLVFGTAYIFSIGIMYPYLAGVLIVPRDQNRMFTDVCNDEPIVAQHCAHLAKSWRPLNFVCADSFLSYQYLNFVVGSPCVLWILGPHAALEQLSQISCCRCLIIANIVMTQEHFAASSPAPAFLCLLDVINGDDRHRSVNVRDRHRACQSHENR